MPWLHFIKNTFVEILSEAVNCYSKLKLIYQGGIDLNESCIDLNESLTYNNF